jgi:1-deoxy-D-xylulose-5-phosphate reductoisomerase
MRHVLILGSTGSIGKQALDVIEHSDDLMVVGLAAGSDQATLLAQAEHHRVDVVALADGDAAASAADSFGPGTVHAGVDGLMRLIIETDCDIVLNAIVGSAGLAATIASLGEGIDLALANKESLVVAGELVMQLAEATGAALIPVDSEHSALHQLIGTEPPGNVERLVLTASGGPFRGRTRAELANVSVEDALAHPTWQMGGKISIDSATLMNKGLEIIEAHHLFGFDYDCIDAVIHPQSIVHALVDLNDGAALAHLGHPDMRVSISYALHHPARADVPLKRLKLADVGSLTFEAPDRESFPCLAIAESVGRIGGSAPCVMNAANEVAVAAFLGGKIPFLAIPETIDRTLEAVEHVPIGHFSQISEIDEEARAKADEVIGETVRTGAG